MSTDRLVVKRQRPVTQRWWLMLAVVFLGLGLYFAYSEGWSKYVEWVSEREQLQLLGARLKDENAVLAERLAAVERLYALERKANSELVDSLRSLQGELLELNEDRAFYRGLVTSVTEKGLGIASFDVASGENEHDYTFRIVLTQNLKGAKVVAGTVDLSVAGKHEGQPKTIAYGELEDARPRPMSFRFTHFQKIEGRLTLPQGFVPVQVDVNVVTEGDRKKNVKKTFEWPIRKG